MDGNGQRAVSEERRVIITMNFTVAADWSQTPNEWLPVKARS